MTKSTREARGEKSKVNSQKLCKPWGIQMFAKAEQSIFSVNKEKVHVAKKERLISV